MRSGRKKMNIPQLPLISPYIKTAFLLAKTKYQIENTAWTNLSGVLAGRFSLPVAMINFQRQSDLDLLLRCMEDEFEVNKATEALGPDFTLHYQMMLSETWVVACYEILRAFRQRDNESGLGDDAVSGLATFKSLFADLELLRMPIAKFEIAKESKIKQPLSLKAYPLNNDATDARFYDREDPTRSYFMQTSVSSRGSMMWLVLDHSASRQYWVERRDLADRLLNLGKEVEPAGLREARIVAEQVNVAQRKSHDDPVRKAQGPSARQPRGQGRV
jgi:hypothetical protein